MSTFVAAIFLSAFLLFSVQPILGKLVLPYLGGSPTVWNTTMMVYQGLLLGGYAYAHLMRDRLGGRLHVRLHLGLLAASLLTMPVVLVTDIWADPAVQPALWLVLSLFATVGLPFFLLSANAPLIQSWFAASGHPHAANPYFLYSASNLGSFLALVSYPLLVERMLGTAEQLTLWSWGYGLFVASVGVIGIGLLRRPAVEARLAPVPHEAKGEEASDTAPTRRDRIFWVTLAFIPSSLLLGVTQYLTTDIAAFPLLWVIPLALYLLTFVIAFSRFNNLLLKNVLNLQIFFLFTAIYTLALQWTDPRVFALHLGAFFVITYVCHGRLAASRPHARHLTEFYLWISLGGVLGGMFNALAAPLLFTEVWEYPLALLAAALLRPAGNAVAAGAGRIRLAEPQALIRALMLGVAAFAVFWLAAQFGGSVRQFNVGMSVAFVLLLGLMFAFARRHPLRVFSVMAATFLCSGLYARDGDIIFKDRNFFGTLKVYYEETRNINKLVHGTTIHSIQSLDPEYRLAPTAYYKPLEDIFSVPGLKNRPMALVGLGGGTVVCFGPPKQQMDVFEINPAMIRVAEDSRYFNYLSDCPSADNINIITGDARLSLASVDDGKYGLIILDAYSSDSLPVHLITREAVALYLEKLRSDGFLVMNISNTHLDLKPVIQGIAQDLGLVAAFGSDEGKGHLYSRSEWAVLSRGNEAPRVLARLPARWKPAPATRMRVWTDDYSNILGSLK